MRMSWTTVACASALLLSGCATKPTAKPFASIWRVRDEVSNELSDAVHDTRQRVSKTWSDVWRDWNYVEEDSFGEIRNAAGR